MIPSKTHIHVVGLELFSIQRTTEPRHCELTINDPDIDICPPSLRLTVPSYPDIDRFSSIHLASPDLGGLPGLVDPQLSHTPNPISAYYASGSDKIPTSPRSPDPKNLYIRADGSILSLSSQ